MVTGHIFFILNFDEEESLRDFESKENSPKVIREENAYAVETKEVMCEVNSLVNKDTGKIGRQERVRRESGNDK